MIEARLRPDGDGTVLTVEERGIPVPELAAHGAGWQTHAEDLATHLAGRERGDSGARVTELKAAWVQRARDLE